MAVNINVPSQVKTYANLAAFPATGALKTIYIAEDTNKTYRWTGSVYVEVSASASGITIGTTAITSGTVGRILFEGTGNVVQESWNLFWDNTNGRLGIGTSSPSFGLDVNGTARFALPANNAYGATISTDANGNTTFSKIGGGASLYFTSTQSIFLNPTQRVGIGNFSSVQPRTLLSVVGGDDSAPALGSANGKFSILNGTGTSGGYGLVFGVQGTGTSHIQSQRVDGSATAYALAIQPAGGNVLINTTTDAGFRLDVNGTARVSASAQIPLRIDGSAAATGVQINSQADNDLRPSYVEFLRGGVSKFFVGFSYGNSGFYIGDGTNPNFNMKSNGNILIGTFTDVACSKLTIESTTQGFLPPRMTTTQKNAIATPAAGLMVYDTTLNVISYYNGTMWI